MLTIAFFGYGFTPLWQILPFIYGLLLAAIVYWFYHWLQTRSLRHATRMAFSD